MIVTDNNSTANAYNFGFLDEYAKKEIRRAILKAIAIPGYQVPYASVNAVNLRQFIEMTCPGISTTTKTDESSLIQSRHRIPERPLTSQQIIVLQVPYPDPLVVVEPSEDKRKTMHGEADYSRLLVKLYEDIVAFDEITISHRYPTRINGHYVIDPSPIPRWDVPKLNDSAALILFGAGREKKIYAVPPHTRAEPLVFSVLVIIGVAFRLVSLLGRPAFASPAATTLLVLAAFAAAPAHAAGAPIPFSMSSSTNRAANPTSARTAIGATSNCCE